MKALVHARPVRATRRDLFTELRDGKTMLAQMVGERMGYAYASFDDDVARGGASRPSRDAWLMNQPAISRSVN